MEISDAVVTGLVLSDAVVTGLVLSDAVVTGLISVIAAIIASIVTSYIIGLRTRRPNPFVHVLLDVGASIRLHPTNIGNATAHDYSITVTYPPKSKITSIENAHFKVKDGGMNDSFVTLFKESVPPGIIWPAIRIDAEREDKVVLPIEISVVCKEQKGIISLPPL